MSGHDFAAMKAALRGGTAVQVAIAPQLFPTPPHVAARMVELLDLDSWNGDPWDTLRVLEPSAGTGNLIAAVLESWPEAHLTAVELNVGLAGALMRKHAGPDCNVIQGDFLRLLPEKTPDINCSPFDAVIMNPPFGSGAWREHLRHAWRFVMPGGRLVAVLPAASDVEKVCKSLSTSVHIEPLPDNTFAGTGVRTVLVLLENMEMPT